MKLSTKLLLGAAGMFAVSYGHGLLSAYFETANLPHYARWSDGTALIACMVAVVLGLAASMPGAGE